MIRAFFKLGAILLLVVVVIVLLIPSIISTHFGSDFLSRKISEQIEGQVVMGSLKTGWFSPLEIDKLSVRDINDQLLVSVESVKLDKGLFSLLWNRKSPSNMAIIGLNAHLSVDEEGRTNLSDLFQKSRLPFIPKESVTVENGSLEVEFSNDGTLHRLLGEAETRFSERKGRLALSFDQTKARALNIAIEQFPMILVERALQWKEITVPPIMHLLGPTLNAEANLNNTALNITVSTQNSTAKLVSDFQESPLKILPKKLNLTLNFAKTSLIEVLFNQRSTEIDSVQGTLNSFPLDWVNTYIAADQRELFHLIIGKTIQGTFKYNKLPDLESAVLSLASAGGASISAQIEKRDNTITLTAPLAVSLENQETMQALWQKYLGEMGKPIELATRWVANIQPEEFRYTIGQPLEKSLSIAHGGLDIGNVTLAPNGRVNDTLLLFNIQTDKAIRIETTPLFFSLTQGMLSLAREDFQVNGQFPFAIWGNLDLRRDEADLRLAIFGKTLSKAFRLKLPESYTLVAPIKGPIEHIRLDTKALAPVLATLGLTSKLPINSLWGELASLSHTLFSEPIPAPTTDPLPWTTEAVKETVKEGQESPVKEMAEPINKIEKKAKKIINKLLGG